eukprot:6199164-Pleurochrysis_carterae.AAC.1
MYVREGTYGSVQGTCRAAASKRHLLATHDGDDSGCPQECFDPHPPSSGSAYALERVVVEVSGSAAVLRAKLGVRAPHATQN